MDPPISDAEFAEISGRLSKVVEDASRRARRGFRSIDLDDLRQESWMAIIDAMRKRSTRDVPEALAYVIAYNASMAYVTTSLRRRKYGATNSVDVEFDHLEASEGRPLEADSIGMRIDLDAALDASKLTARQRSAFELRHRWGMTMEEVGATIGAGASKVGSLAHTASVKLRGGLGPSYGAWSLQRAETKLDAKSRREKHNLDMRKWRRTRNVTAIVQEAAAAKPDASVAVANVAEIFNPNPSGVTPDDLHRMPKADPSARGEDD